MKKQLHVVANGQSAQRLAFARQHNVGNCRAVKAAFALGTSPVAHSFLTFKGWSAKPGALHFCNGVFVKKA